SSFCARGFRILNLVAQTFQSAGSRGLSSPHAQLTELESSVNPQTGKSALRRSGRVDEARDPYTSASGWEASPNCGRRTFILSIMERYRRHIWRSGFSL